MAGLLDNILGSSFDDPKTAATLMLAQGLLTSPKAMQGLSGGLLGYQNAMAEAKKAKQMEEMRQMQVQQQQMAMEQARQAQAKQAAIEQAYRGALRTPDQMAMAKHGGPTVAAAGAAQGMAPGLDQNALIQGLIGADPMAAAQMLQPKQAKIKDYKEVRMPDGSVQIVGFDEFGKPVDTGRTPFKDAVEMDLGGVKAMRDPLSGKIVNQFAKSNTPDALLSSQTTMRGQNMTDARAREANDINKQAARVQVVSDPERGTFLVDKGTGLMRSAIGMDGKPIRSEAQTASAKRSSQLMVAMDQAEDLLKQSPTGSYIGAGMDQAARAVGLASKSAQTAAQLETLGGWLVANVPRMEGPQSNIDVENYKTMAARVGDRTLPVSVRLASLEALREIQGRYADLNGGAPPRPSAGGLKFLGFE